MRRGVHMLLAMLTTRLTVSSSALPTPPAPQAFPPCVFDHWELMTPDPLQSGSQTNEIVLNIRKRKGAHWLGRGAAGERRTRGAPAALAPCCMLRWSWP